MRKTMTWTIVATVIGMCGCGQPAADSDPSKAASADPAATSGAPPSDGQGPPPEQPRETVPEQSEPEPSVGASSATTPEAAADAVALVDLPWEEILQRIAEHRGKIVVVDLWATYCQPCRESFPGLVALSRLDPENIVCISVSLDDPADTEKRGEALAFLQEQQARMANYLCTTDADTLYDQILKIGGIPAVYVYGRDGQLAKVFNGPTPEGTDHTYDQHITPFVTELAATR